MSNESDFEFMGLKVRVMDCLPEGVALLGETKASVFASGEVGPELWRFEFDGVVIRGEP